MVSVVFDVDLGVSVFGVGEYVAVVFFDVGGSVADEIGGLSDFVAVAF